MQQLRVQLPELLEVHLHQAGHIVPGVCRAPPWNRKGNGLKRRGLGRVGQGRAGQGQRGRAGGGAGGLDGGAGWPLGGVGRPCLPPSPLVCYPLCSPGYTT